MFPLCSGQYLIKKLSKEGRAVNQQQGHGEPKLTVACGEQRLVCVVWSISYWNQSFWKKLTLVLIESCQNTECIIMGLPMVTPVHRPKHQQWTRVRDALWEEGKLAEAVWCYVGKTWVLLSLWIFCFDMYHLPKHRWRPSTWACYSLMAGAIFSMHPSTKQIWFSNDLHINTVWGVNLASKLLRFHYNQASVGCARQTSPIHGCTTLQLKGPKVSVAHFQIPQLQGSRGVCASLG